MKNKDQIKAKKLQEQLSEEENKIRKKYKINLLMCLIGAVLTQMYFIILNINSMSDTLDLYIKISYSIFIIIAILMFEEAYRRNEKSLAINGIEFIILAIHILLLNKNTNKELDILQTSYIWPIYYCLKATIIYTKENRRRLRKISDIYDIVKEEKPTKKVAKKRKK